MRRFTTGVAVAAAMLLLLAWVWPDGADQTSTERRPEPAATGDVPSPSEEPASEPAESPDPPDRSVEPAVVPTEEPDLDVFTGPFGTRARTGGASLALTFDDGPDPKWTPKVLSVLRERGVKATFCVIGANAEAHPELIADIVHDGHTLCSHTWYHELDLGARSRDEIRANLQRTEDAIQKAAPGAEVVYFRHPGGNWTERAVSVAAELGMESLHWAVDPFDWDQRRAGEDIEKDVLKHAEPGAVVLLHDGGGNQKHMYAALGPILDEFDRRGYALASL